MPDEMVQGSHSADGDIPINIPALHQSLVDKLKANENILTAPVEAAFRAVPRHLFLPTTPLERVYDDQAVVTRFQDGRPISSSSQPAIMAIMLEQLGLQPGHRVLEIGAGTGYNAALMAHIVGSSGRVTTMDLDEEIVAEARLHLATAGFTGVNVVCGDGMLGFAPDAPYDRIILTVGGWDIPPEWLAQLKPDGRLVLPLSLNGPQFSVAFDRTNDHLHSVSIHACGFMRIRGSRAEPETTLSLGPESDLLLSLKGAGAESDPTADTFFQWLNTPYQDRPTGIEVPAHQVWSSLDLWLALSEPRVCHLSAQGAAAEPGLVPYLFSFNREPGRFVATFGLWSNAGLSLLMRPPGESPFTAPPAEPEAPFSLFVRSFGADNALTQQLISSLHVWDQAGRPGSEWLRIRAYPATMAYVPQPGEQVITTPSRHLVLDWLL